MENNKLENTTIAALAAASESPFKTALKVTLGIAVAHLITFVAIVSVVVVAIKILT